MNFPAFSFPHLPGRNDPCWCGSGRKYKSCHAAFDQQIAALAAQGHIVPTHKMIKTPEQIAKIKARFPQTIERFEGEIAQKMSVRRSERFNKIFSWRSDRDRQK